MNQKPTYTTIDEYIQLFPEEIQERMEKLRQVIHEAAPEAKEKISWRMPTFDYYGNLVHFAAQKNHMGFYPGASGVASFRDDLTDYITSKGAIQFPHSKSIPYDLVEKIVLFRVEQNKQDHEAKKLTKKK